MGVLCAVRPTAGLHTQLKRRHPETGVRNGSMADRQTYRQPDVAGSCLGQQKKEGRTGTMHVRGWISRSPSVELGGLRSSKLCCASHHAAALCNMARQETPFWGHGFRSFHQLCQFQKTRCSGRSNIERSAKPATSDTRGRRPFSSMSQGTLGQIRAWGDPEGAPRQDHPLVKEQTTIHIRMQTHRPSN